MQTWKAFLAGAAGAALVVALAFLALPLLPTGGGTALADTGYDHDAMHQECLADPEMQRHHQSMHPGEDMDQHHRSHWGETGGWDGMGRMMEGWRSGMMGMMGRGMMGW